MSRPNSHEAAPKIKGILKNPIRPPLSPTTSRETSPNGKLNTRVEKFVRNPVSESFRQLRHTSRRGASIQTRPNLGREPSDTESDDNADLDNANFGAKHRVLEAVATMSKCQACWKPLGEFEGFVLKDCQAHVVCKSCLFHGVQDANALDQMPVCPVDKCRAVIRDYELESICSEDPTQSGNRESETSQNNIKKPTSSNLDDSEEIVHTEELLLPRENQTTIVAVSGHCDKCKKTVDRVGYLDIRNCKLKHKSKKLKHCIRAAVKISKNLVRCPLYRECKSMMARDEVLQARYDLKEAADQRDLTRSPAKSKTKTIKYIYPNGLPKGDLWPVLSNTKCSKCSRDIDVLTGIVIQQCNIHCVCVRCVREKIAMNRELVECPMYQSCKAMMMDIEVEAFINRFGGPPEV